MSIEEFMDWLGPKMSWQYIKDTYFYMPSWMFWMLVYCMVIVVVFSLVARSLWGV